MTTARSILMNLGSDGQAWAQLWMELWTRLRLGRRRLSIELSISSGWTGISPRTQTVSPAPWGGNGRM